LWAVLLGAGLLALEAGRVYSVQTHEQLIDLAWKASIVPWCVDD